MTRLKSLELHGYKTFAGITNFEFAGAITAIVGPNGSGKSNIADAIRWVLGEQSYSLLRGKKTEDMIFSGSEMRPRAGMASAMITFDNSDGWLPIDFGEVAITRRAYRDGDNEYLLNGQRVRLKDVSELLAQSGLAERTYTVIGQGLVDAALALKAEERRRLFEEAAGIGLHRARKEEALRRLETTHRNLERVQDILAELQPRLRSLERQARRVDEWERVKAGLRDLLREWYGYQWGVAQKELAEAREAARRQETALDIARAEQLDLDQQLTHVRQQAQDLRAWLSNQHRALSQLHSQREAASRDLAVSVERQRSLVANRRSAEEESARLEEDLAFWQERLASAAGELGRLEEECQEAEAQLAKARQDLKQRQAERQSAEEALSLARQSQADLIARENRLQARLIEHKSAAARRETTLHEAQLACEANLADEQVASRKLAAAQAAYQTASSQRQDLEQAAAGLNRQLGELQKQRKSVHEQSSALGIDLARLRAQLEVVEQAEKAMAGYSKGARLLAQESQANRLPGVLGLLAARLEILPGMETAIAAALGEWSEAVLLEAPDSVETAADTLQNAASRAALVPVKFSAGGRQPADSDLIDGRRASEVVICPPELRPVVDWLLGGTWIVEDRLAARRWLAQPGIADLSSGRPEPRCVTRSGEVYYLGGAVIAGQEPREAVFGRPRQRREYAEKISQAESNLSKYESGLRLLDGQITTLARQVEDQTRNLKQARENEDNRAAETRQADLALEKVRRAVQWHREQQARIESERDASQTEGESLQSQLSEIAPQLATAQLSVRQANEALQEVSLEEAQEQVSHWSALASVAQRSAGEARQRQAQWQAAFEKSQQAHRLLNTRLGENRAASEGLENERLALRQSELALSAEIDDLTREIEPAETKLISIEAQQTTVQEKEAEARQALTFAEHQHSQARLLFARRQEALDNLKRRIEEDFGLVAFDYREDISGQAPLPLEGMVEQLPKNREIPPDLEDNIQRQRNLLRRLGPINPEAQQEYHEVKERYEFLTSQVGDLNRAVEDLHQVIAELDGLMEREFRKTFEKVAVEFKEIFIRLFNGGSAKLVLTDPQDLTTTGIDIEARLPGRRTQGLSLLSGGERSLTATALVFSLLKVSPTPFCILDEVDAMLDEANVGRFRDLLRELSANTQFIIVTHNRNTVQAADVIYGVTMGRDSTSQVLSLRLDQVSQVVG